MVAIERQVLGEPDKRVQVRFDPLPEKQLEAAPSVDAAAAREEAEALLRALTYEEQAADEDVIEAGGEPVV